MNANRPITAQQTSILNPVEDSFPFMPSPTLRQAGATHFQGFASPTPILSCSRVGTPPLYGQGRHRILVETNFITQSHVVGTNTAGRLIGR